MRKQNEEEDEFSIFPGAMDEKRFMGGGMMWKNKRKMREAEEEEENDKGG